MWARTYAHTFVHSSLVHSLSRPGFFCDKPRANSHRCMRHPTSTETDGLLSRLEVSLVFRKQIYSMCTSRTIGGMCVYN